MTLLISQIKNKMKEVGITPSAVEKRAGLKPSAVHNILYGKSKNPSINTLQAIAKVLNCSVLDIIGEENTNSSVQKVDSDIAYNSELYLSCLSYVSNLLRNTFLEKEQILKYVDEVYIFSYRRGEGVVDKKFADFLIERDIKMKIINKTED